MAQCYDSLETIRHVLNIKARLVEFKNRNVCGKRDGLRSRTVIDQVHDRAKVAAERYRVARRAKMALAGAREWEETLCMLNDGDIRGYQDPDHLQVHAGHRGTLEDEQVVAAAAEVQEDVDMGNDVVDESLLEEVREKRDGTGETCHTLSWIWTTKSRMPSPDDESDDISGGVGQEQGKGSAMLGGGPLVEGGDASDYCLPGLENKVVDGSPGCQNQRHQQGASGGAGRIRRGSGRFAEDAKGRVLCHLEGFPQ